MRHKRLSLSPQNQRIAAWRLDRNIARSGLLLRRGSTALYFANDGEIDPSILMSRLLKYRRHCLFPVISRNGFMGFARYQMGDKLEKNSFGIPEPSRQSRLRKAWSVTLILMPLVGFDRAGGRLGMGGGFYDRSLKNTRSDGRKISLTPLLVGIAHQCQEVSKLPQDKWDVNLSMVVTDQEIIAVPKKYN